MIEITRFDDVIRLRFWTRRTTAVGYDVSAYMVRGVLVDTGFPHVFRDVATATRELRPRGAIVTHWHEDHSGNAPVIAEALPMWLAPYTEQKLRERRQIRLYRHFTWGRPAALTAKPRPLDLHDLQIIPAPGHSPDHHVVFDPRTATLFSADLWLGVKVRAVGTEENPYEILSSLTRAIALEPRRMFDAHRGLVADPIAALDAKRAWLRETIDAIERRLDSGASDSAILREVLDGEESVAWVSQGEYSRRNLVRSVRRYRSA